MINDLLTFVTNIRIMLDFVGVFWMRIEHVICKHWYYTNNLQWSDRDESPTDGFVNSVENGFHNSLLMQKILQDCVICAHKGGHCKPMLSSTDP